MMGNRKIGVPYENLNFQNGRRVFVLTPELEFIWRVDLQDLFLLRHAGFPAAVLLSAEVSAKIKGYVRENNTADF